ncbi:hypothetical protein K0B90_01715 [bacterium]|nr:hypothetical protein [bacterium]
MKRIACLIVVSLLIGCGGGGGGGGNGTNGAAPVVATSPATLVGSTTATLNGNVTANGLTTNAWFEWGTDSTLTTSTSTSSQSIGSGTTSQAVNAVLTGLSTGTTYYYRVVASNSLGTTPGNIANFIPDYVGLYSGTSQNTTSGIDNVVDIDIDALAKSRSLTTG